MKKAFFPKSHFFSDSVFDVGRLHDCRTATRYRRKLVLRQRRSTKVSLRRSLRRRASTHSKKIKLCRSRSQLIYFVFISSLRSSVRRQLSSTYQQSTHAARSRFANLCWQILELGRCSYSSMCDIAWGSSSSCRYHSGNSLYNLVTCVKADTAILAHSVGSSIDYIVSRIMKVS